MRPDPENRVGDQYIGKLGRPVSFGLQVPGDFPAAFFLQNVLQLQQHRSLILGVDSLAL